MIREDEVGHVVTRMLLGKSARAKPVPPVAVLLSFGQSCALELRPILHQSSFSRTPKREPAAEPQRLGEGRREVHHSAALT